MTMAFAAGDESAIAFKSSGAELLPAGLVTFCRHSSAFPTGSGAADYCKR